MAKKSKLPSNGIGPKGSLLIQKLDVTSSGAALAFRAAAEAYTKESTKTKASAIRTLHREGILTKGGKFAKAYASKS